MMPMDYDEAVRYLYEVTPQFQQIGAAAYKPGLDTVRRLSALTGDSHRKFPSVHVAGTNGKGSTSHLLSAVLQSAGYRVGLFTSPHLIDFRERIRVDGVMVSKDDVVKWLEHYLLIKPDDLQPSFFELTTVMAFDLFAASGVDVAVVEVGLGGRLDSTNIITPVLSVITNISKDHTAQLGADLGSIAFEKAGIIKPEVPVVLGESDVKDVVEVVKAKAEKEEAPLYIADNPPRYSEFIVGENPGDGILYHGTPYGDITGSLMGSYQSRNANTVLAALQLLDARGWKIGSSAVRKGFAEVGSMTGLRGRWSVVSFDPLTICDTGHNEGGWAYLSAMLKKSGKELFMVIGFVSDKDIESVMRLMPENAHYYFTKPSVPRAMDPLKVKVVADRYSLKGKVFDSVSSAVDEARSDALRSGKDSLVFVGGSTFVVADFLS